MNKKKLRIVVVDDDELNLFILLKIVNDNNHTAKGFGGGIAAWEYLQKNSSSVDMVILDKMMQDMDGLEVMAHMKNHSTLRNIPVIMQTGDADLDRKQEGLALGADDYLIKPYRKTDILESINIIANKYIFAEVAEEAA